MAHVVMTPAEELQNLKETVAMLNDTSDRMHDWQGKNYGYDDAVRLRRLVLAWVASGRDRRNMKLSKQDREKLESFTGRIRVTTAPNGMLVVIDFYPHPYDSAAINFTRLIRNSQRARLRGPCVQCGLWYISKTQKETLYCSRKCAGGAAKAKERKRRRDGVMKKVRQAIENYETRPARFAEMPWKEFVRKAVPGVSKKFLTMAVRNGELLPPKEGE